MRQLAHPTTSSQIVWSPISLRNIKGLEQSWIEQRVDWVGGILVVQISQVSGVILVQLVNAEGELFGRCKVVHADRGVVGRQEAGVILGSVQDGNDSHGVGAFDFFGHVVVAVGVLDTEVELVPCHDLAIREFSSIFVRNRGKEEIRV